MASRATGIESAGALRLAGIRSGAGWPNSFANWTDERSARSGEHRELLVYLMYPINKQTAGSRANYFPHQKEIEAFEESFGKNFFKRSYGS